MPVGMKFVKKNFLTQLNRAAICNNFEKTIEQSFIDALPEDICFPILNAEQHEYIDKGSNKQTYVRCKLLLCSLKSKPNKAPQKKMIFIDSNAIEMINIFDIDMETVVYNLIPVTELPIKAPSDDDPVPKMIKNLVPDSSNYHKYN
jgi:hypothetical protein